MRRVRVSLTLDEDVRERLANQARARPESLDAYLRRLVLAAGGEPDPELADELQGARAEARARAREAGELRRRVRELEVRLNSLHAGAVVDPMSPAPWSLDYGRRDHEQLGAWWRWLEAGVRRLRQRYQLVELDYAKGGETNRWWWESPLRVRAIAIAVAWEEALDRGGDSVPSDPRFAEAFLDYVGRLRSRSYELVNLGRYFGPDPGLPESATDSETLAEERVAFEAHVSRLESRRAMT